MLELFPYNRRYWYPHMKPNDIAIWERFLVAFPDAYNTVQYDVGIGDIPPFMEQTSSPQGQAMRELYRLKIDVIGYNDGVIDIIEVKHDASPSSIGQLEGYRALYVRDYNPPQNLGAVLLTNTRRPNMDFLCAQAGIKLIVV